MAELKLTDVSIELGGRQVLRDVSFATEAGVGIAIVGPNGAGKTTLLRAIAGHQPYTGEILLDGREIRDWKSRDIARKLSFVRQSLPISFDFSILDIVLLGRAPYKSLLQTYDRSDRELASSLLEELDLSGFESRSILEVSGGERQRVLLAQALAQKTDLILLDEPTTHLDVHHKYDFMSRVKDYVSQGKTVIAAIHDLQLAAGFADRIIVLSGGSVATEGAPGDIITSSMISDVFDINVNVEHDSDGDIFLHYKI